MERTAAKRETMVECDGKVHVTISGITGVGKSAIYHEIEIAMKAIGVAVEHHDPVEAKAEKNGTGANIDEYLEMYKPTVVLHERNVSRLACPSKRRDRRA